VKVFFISIIYVLELLSFSYCKAQNNELNRCVTLSISNIPLREALKMISEQVEIYFMYDDEIIESKMISGNFSNEPVDNCLSRFLSPFQIEFKKVAPATYILHKNNQRTIHGYVYDNYTKNPLPFTNIYIQGTNIGITTDTTGAFQLKIPIDTELLTISFMGYQTKTVHLLKNTADFQIPMNPIVILLQPIQTSAEAIKEIDINANNELLRNEQSIGLGGTSYLMQNSINHLPDMEKVAEYISKQDVKEEKIKYDNNKTLQSSDAAVTYIQNRIRQGQFRDDLTIVDGIRFSEPFHIKIVPGIDASIYSPEMMNQATYLNGGFDVVYGDALNSILNIRYRNNGQKMVAGNVMVGISGQECFLSSNNHSGYSLMIHARRNDDKNLPTLIKTDRQIEPEFYDIQAKLNYTFSRKHNIEMYVLHSKDRCMFSPGKRTYYEWNLLNVYNQESLVFDHIEEYREDQTEYKMDIFSLKSQHEYSKFTMNVRLTYFDSHLSDYSKSNYFASSTFTDEPRYFSIINKEQEYSNKLTDKSFESEIVFSYKSKNLDNNRLGFIYQPVRYSKDYLLIEPQVWETNLFRVFELGLFDQQHPTKTIISDYSDSASSTINTYKFSSYYLKQLQIKNDIHFNLGIRLDYFHLNKQFSVNPRIRLNYLLSQNKSIGAAFGLYSQTPYIHQIQNYHNNSGNIKNQLAVHYIAFLNTKLNETWSVRTEIFFKQLKRLIPVNRLSDGSLANVLKNNYNEGYSRGIHIKASYMRHPLKFNINYTLMKANERLINTSRYYHRFNDQRHTFCSTLSYIHGKNFQFTLRSYYGSGYAYTPFLISNIQDKEKWIAAEHNSAYFPAYTRMDIEIKRNFPLRYGSLQLYIKLINIFNRKNIFAYSYSYNSSGVPIRNPQILYGFIPLAGLCYSF